MGVQVAPFNIMGNLVISLNFSESNAAVSSLLYEYPSTTARNETITALRNLLSQFEEGSRVLVSGQQVLGGVAATGNVVFADQPSAADSITINGRAYTFVASGATTYQVNIGADLPATIAAFVAKYNANKATTAANAAISISSDSTHLYFTADNLGIQGNDYTLAASGANLTASGANFTGGTAATSSYTF